MEVVFKHIESQGTGTSTRNRTIITLWTHRVMVLFTILVLTYLASSLEAVNGRQYNPRLNMKIGTSTQLSKKHIADLPVKRKSINSGKEVRNSKQNHVHGGIKKIRNMKNNHIHEKVEQIKKGVITASDKCPPLPCLFIPVACRQETYFYVKNTRCKGCDRNICRESRRDNDRLVGGNRSRLFSRGFQLRRSLNTDRRRRVRQEMNSFRGPAQRQNDWFMHDREFLEKNPDWREASTLSQTSQISALVDPLSQVSSLGSNEPSTQSNSLGLVNEAPFGEVGRISRGRTSRVGLSGLADTLSQVSSLGLSDPLTQSNSLGLVNEAPIGEVGRISRGRNSRVGLSGLADTLSQIRSLGLSDPSSQSNSLRFANEAAFGEDDRISRGRNSQVGLSQGSDDEFAPFSLASGFVDPITLSPIRIDTRSSTATSARTWTPTQFGRDLNSDFSRVNDINRQINPLVTSQTGFPERFRAGLDPSLLALAEPSTTWSSFADNSQQDQPLPTGPLNVREFSAEGMQINDIGRRDSLENTSWLNRIRQGSTGLQTGGENSWATVSP